MQALGILAPVSRPHGSNPSLKDNWDCYSFRVRPDKDKSNTSKVGAIGQLGVLAVLGEDADHPMLDEVHLLADGALPDDVVGGLEHLKAELCQHRRHKVGISIGEERHGRHQLPAVEVNDLLRRQTRLMWGQS